MKLSDPSRRAVNSAESSLHPKKDSAESRPAGQFFPEESRADGEIRPAASRDNYEERHRGSNMFFLGYQYNWLMSYLGFHYFWSQESLRSEGITGLRKEILKGNGDAIVLMFLMGLELLQLYCVTRLRFYRHRVSYGSTAAEVLQHYAFLLLINRSYIRIAIFPVIILVFIGGFARKFEENPRLYYISSEVGIESDRERMKMALIPCCLQLSFVIWTRHSGGEQGGTFVHCHFLLFINSSLAALATMISRSPIGVSPGPGVEQVLSALHKSCLLMLLLATWTMAAEWLGEGVILFCMPEFIAVVVWFTNRFENAGRIESFNAAAAWARWGTTGLTILLVLRTDLFFTYVKKILVESTFYIVISSSALSYLHVWVLHQWWGTTSNSNGPIEPIIFSVEYSLYTTVLLGVWSVGLWILELEYGDQVPILATRLLLLIGLIVYLTIRDLYFHISRKVNKLMVKLLIFILVLVRKLGIRRQRR